MGGRGSFSSSHGGVKRSIHRGGSFYISEKPETRADIRKLFIDELGFSEIYGTQSIPTAQLAALGIQLKKSEKEYHTLRGNDVFLSTTKNPSTKGAAVLFGDGSMALLINPTAHSSVSSYKNTLRREQAEGFKTKTDKKITNDFSYTARHEYGHLTQFSLMKQTGKTADQMRSDIQSIAKTKYNSKKNSPSKYGASDNYEFFAESFASMTGGNPNAQGKALRDYLSK